MSCRVKHERVRQRKEKRQWRDDSTYRISERGFFNRGNFPDVSTSVNLVEPLSCLYCNYRRCVRVNAPSLPRVSLFFRSFFFGPMCVLEETKTFRAATCCNACWVQVGVTRIMDMRQQPSPVLASSPTFLRARTQPPPPAPPSTLTPRLDHFIA